MSVNQSTNTERPSSDTHARTWFGQLLRSDDGMNTVRATLSEVGPAICEAFCQSLKEGRFNELEHAALYLALPRLRALGFSQISLGEQGVEAVSGSGCAYLFVPVSHGWSAKGLGHPDDVERLLTGLHESIGGLSPYQVHIKRPLPRGLDVQSICRAVQLWALSQPNTAGGCAAYLDGDVALEVCMYGEQGAEGRTALIGPLDAQDRLLAVEQRLHALAADLGEQDREWVGLITSDGPLSFPRWALQQVFYGCPVEALSDSAGYRVRFSEPGGLLGDKRGGVWSALWWLEAAPQRCWTLENPWAPLDERVARVGRTFAASDKSGVELWLSWEQP